jgi:hypothetical protein
MTSIIDAPTLSSQVPVLHCTEVSQQSAGLGHACRSNARPPLPVFTQHRTFHCAAASDELGQSTKSLRDSPLGRVLEAIGR